MCAPCPLTGHDSEKDPLDRSLNDGTSACAHTPVYVLWLAHKWFKGLLEALSLGSVDEFRQLFPESWVLDSGKDILPPVGLEQAVFDPLGLLVAKGPAVRLQKIFRIRPALFLEDSVNGTDELDKVIHGPVTFVIGQFCIFTGPFEAVHDCVVSLFLPVKQKQISE